MLHESVVEIVCGYVYVLRLGGVPAGSGDVRWCLGVCWRLAVMVACVR